MNHTKPLIRRGIILIWVILGSCSASLSTYAQTESERIRGTWDPPKIRVDRYSSEMGAPATYVHQGQDGRLILLNPNTGVHLLDGYASKRIDFETDKTPRIWYHFFIESQDGMLWVATNDGLFVYAPETDTHVRYVNDPANPRSLSSDRVLGILEDQQGQVWVAGPNGLNRYEPETNDFSFYPHEGDVPPMSWRRDKKMLQDNGGRIWMGDWGLIHFDPASESYTRYLPNPDNSDHEHHENQINSIYEDSQNRLWVGTNIGSLFTFDWETKSFEMFREASPLAATPDAIKDVEEDPVRGMWITTQLQGLFWLDTDLRRLQHYPHDPTNPHSPSSANLSRLERDRQGGIWVARESGVDRFDRSVRFFDQPLKRPTDLIALQRFGGGVNGIVDTPDGMIWIISGGTEWLTRIDRNTEEVQWFRPAPDEESSASGFTWRTMKADQNGTIWAAVGPELVRMEYERPGIFERFRHDPSDAQSLPDSDIDAIHIDAQDELWIAHESGVMSRMSVSDTGIITQFELPVRGVTNIYRDAAGIVWVGTQQNGLVRLDPLTGVTKNYVLDEEQTGSGLSYSFVEGMCERPEEPDVLWIAVYYGGLNRLDKSTGTFSYLTTRSSSIPHDGVFGLICDEKLWISTDGGIASYSPESETFTLFTADDGMLPGFSNPSYHQSPFTGEIFFGGSDGINSFYPDEIGGNPFSPEVNITGLRLFGETLEPGEHSRLERPLSQSDAITFAHDQNDLTFEYVGLHYRNPSANTYAYKLEPADADWRQVGTTRIAQYSNIEPGEYTFRVKAASSDGVWNEEGAALGIVILKPWWKTTWAFLMYGILFIGGVFAADRVQRGRVLRQEREEAALREAEMERENATRLKAAHDALQESMEKLTSTQDQLVQSQKMASLGELTAGIAHEIKNPLNFVNNFAEVSAELADELGEVLAGDEREEVLGILNDLKQNALVIFQHSKRADGIVHAMMQHASGGSGHRELTDINQLVFEQLELAYHGKRAQVTGLDVEIKQDLDPAAGEIELIPQEIGRVLINLMGNALDALHEKGQIGSQLSVVTLRSDDTVEIRISDNGPGIPLEIQDKIFEPFFTTKPTGSGTGLGLSLSYDIVTKGHGGSLKVESEEGHGATFVVQLPTNG